MAAAPPMDGMLIMSNEPSESAVNCVALIVKVSKDGGIITHIAGT